MLDNNVVRNAIVNWFMKEATVKSGTIAGRALNCPAIRSLFTLSANTVMKESRDQKKEYKPSKVKSFMFIFLFLLCNYNNRNIVIRI